MTTSDIERHPDARDVRTAWDRMADAYDANCGTDGDYYRTEVMGPALLRACGNLRGKRLLDLGCGQGFFTRLAARAGAYVTGVDISEGQIANAFRRESEEELGIAYEVLDAARIADRYDPASFDLIVSCIALQDMPDLPSVLEGATRLLAPSGRAVFLVEHPMNTTAYREWERDAQGGKVVLRVDRYFDTGPRTVTWTMADVAGQRHTWSFPSWARTLEEWSDLIESAGLAIVRLREPRATREQVERAPDLDDCSRIPYYLVFELRVA